jgi:hypothetical protein
VLTDVCLCVCVLCVCVCVCVCDANFAPSCAEERRVLYREKGGCYAERESERERARARARERESRALTETDANFTPSCAIASMDSVAPRLRVLRVCWCFNILVSYTLTDTRTLLVLH